MSWLKCGVCGKEFHCIDLFQDKKGKLYCAKCKGKRKLDLCEEGKFHLVIGLAFYKAFKKESKAKLIGGTLIERLREKGLIES